MTGRSMLAAALVLAALPAAAQNAEKTGVGAALGELQAVGDDLNRAFDEQWSGTPGRLAKGAIATGGIAAALGMAREALLGDLMSVTVRGSPNNMQVIIGGPAGTGDEAPPNTGVGSATASGTGGN